MINVLEVLKQHCAMNVLEVFLFDAAAGTKKYYVPAAGTGTYLLLMVLVPYCTELPRRVQAVLVLLLCNNYCMCSMYDSSCYNVLTCFCSTVLLSFMYYVLVLVAAQLLTTSLRRTVYHHSTRVQYDV